MLNAGRKYLGSGDLAGKVHSLKYTHTFVTQSLLLVTLLLTHSLTHSLSFSVGSDHLRAGRDEWSTG